MNREHVIYQSFLLCMSTSPNLTIRIFSKPFKGLCHLNIQKEAYMQGNNIKEKTNIRIDKLINKFYFVSDSCIHIAISYTPKTCLFLEYSIRQILQFTFMHYWKHLFVILLCNIENSSQLYKPHQYNSMRKC